VREIAEVELLLALSRDSSEAGDQNSVVRRRMQIQANEVFNLQPEMLARKSSQGVTLGCAINSIKQTAS
jgi:hypothetical protein